MHILGIHITTLSKKEILEKISLKIKSCEKTVVFTPNPEMIEFAYQNRENNNVVNGLKPFTTDNSYFHNLLNTSDFNLPDGIGLKIACNFRHPFSVSCPPIIHGIDFMLDLCAEAEKNGWSVGLLGGMNGVASKTRESLTTKFPNLHITYTYGDFEYNPDTFSPTTYNLQPTTCMNILFVAMGSPKEQLWINANRDTFPATVFMEVGGSFDILSGKLHRAPKIMQKLGLEWLFRLIQEPRRISRQINLIKFLFRVLTTKNSIEK